MMISDYLINISFINMLNNLEIQVYESTINDFTQPGSPSSHFAALRTHSECNCKK